MVKAQNAGGHKQACPPQQEQRLVPMGHVAGGIIVRFQPNELATVQEIEQLRSRVEAVAGVAVEPVVLVLAIGREPRRACVSIPVLVVGTRAMRILARLQAFGQAQGAENRRDVLSITKHSGDPCARRRAGGRVTQGFQGGVTSGGSLGKRLLALKCRSFALP